MLSRYGRVVGIAAGVAFLLWGVGLGYWRFVVTSSISAVESAAKPANASGEAELVVAEVLEEFKKTGDRSLPYIIEALKPDRNPSFLAALSRHFLERIVRLMPLTQADDMRIIPADRPEEIERKIGELRAIWRQMEPRYRWWMWWTADGLE